MSIICIAIEQKTDLLPAILPRLSSLTRGFRVLNSAAGKIIAFTAKELEQVIQFGWSQQSPRAWWEGLVVSFRQVLERVADGANRIATIAGCGQMHGVMLVGGAGELVLEDLGPVGKLAGFLLQMDPSSPRQEEKFGGSRAGLALLRRVGLASEAALHGSDRC